MEYVVFVSEKKKMETEKDPKKVGIEKQMQLFLWDKRS